MQMSDTLNRVVSLKARTNDTQRFDKHFDAYVAAVVALNNQFVAYGNDKVYTRLSTMVDPDQTHDLAADRQRLYLAYIDPTKLTGEQFELCLKLLYTATNNASQPRGMVSSLIGNPAIKDLVNDWNAVVDATNAENWKKEDTEKYMNLVYRVSNTLADAGFRKQDFFNSGCTPGEKMGIVANVARMQSSWKECDIARSTSYAEEAAEIERDLSALDPVIRKDLQAFVAELSDNDVIKDIDPRFRSYLECTIIPRLNGETVEEDHFIGGKGEEIPYSLDPKLSEFLGKYPSLWQGDEPKILDLVFIAEKVFTHQNHHPHAYFPMMTQEDGHRVQYCLGKNYIGYTMVPTGADLEDTVYSVTKFKEEKTYKFTKGKQVDTLHMSFKRGREDKEPVEFQIFIKQKYNSNTDNPNPYFKNLKVWSNEEDPNMNLFEFERKGRVFRALIKEPSIIRNSDGHYEVRLNMTIANDAKDEETQALCHYLSSSLPCALSDKSKSKEEPKNVDRLKILKGNTYKFLGVDFGLRAPFAWAVGESTITGAVNQLTILKTGEYSGTDTVMHARYIEQMAYETALGKIIGMAKSTINGSTLKRTFARNGFDKKIGPEELIRAAQQHFSDKLDDFGSEERKVIYAEFVNASLSDLFEKFTSDLTDHGIGMKERKDYLVNILYRFVRANYCMIVELRKYSLSSKSVDTKQDFEFKWLECIERFKRLKRSMSYFGTGNDRKPITLDAMGDYYNGCKDNFLKVIAASIVKVAVDNGCRVIVLEDLKMSQSSKAMTKREENFMHSLWSPACIQAAVENCAEWYGIPVATVDESQTSKVHFETGAYGYRYGANLYYLNAAQDGFLTTHADMNAAKNILNKFVTRHASSSQIMIAKAKDLVDPASTRVKSKRFQGFLTEKFKSVPKAVAFVSQPKYELHQYLYLHQGNWITLEDRKALEAKIKGMVEATKLLAFKA
jgi:IS605 OrfB family transposase